MKQKHLFTSESVSIGHPDKICDIISDTILDMYLSKDKTARVACEVMFTHKKIIIGGEITSKKKFSDLEIKHKIKQTLNDIAQEYIAGNYEIDLQINKQSPEINAGVDKEDGDIGAGDQGMMFGYACSETEEGMPLAITIAHLLTREINAYRIKEPGAGLGADGKTQVTVEYKDNIPVGIHDIVISWQHTTSITLHNLRQFLKRFTYDIFRNNGYSLDLLKNTKFHINPAGTFHVGGSEGDCGLTGRKIIVDTYGGACPSGGGNFQGKDPSKVDRSGAYMARYIAKNLWKAGYGDQVEVQISYAIGEVQPVSVMIKADGRYLSKKQIKKIRKVFDLSPKGIIDSLGLLDMSYVQTAKNGHFGKPEFPWEKTDKVKELKRIKGK